MAGVSARTVHESAQPSRRSDYPRDGDSHWPSWIMYVLVAPTPSSAMAAALSRISAFFIIGVGCRRTAAAPQQADAKLQRNSDPSTERFSPSPTAHPKLTHPIFIQDNCNQFNTVVLTVVLTKLELVCFTVSPGSIFCLKCGLRIRRLAPRARGNQHKQASNLALDICGCESASCLRSLRPAGQATVIPNTIILPVVEFRIHLAYKDTVN